MLLRPGLYITDQEMWTGVNPLWNSYTFHPRVIALHYTGQVG